MSTPLIFIADDLMLGKSVLGKAGGPLAPGAGSGNHGPPVIARRTMKRALFPLGLAMAGPALAAPGGPIDTIHRGEYYCKLPGDATGLAGLVVAEEGFTIISGSSYMTPSGGGSYLLTGDELVMTSGPKRGQRFNRISDNFLRKLGADRKESTLRCVRRTRNNS
jgi:hypothetical protein